MGAVHNPHDKFFKTSMSNLQVALSFFDRHLPLNIKAELDFNTLELQPGTFIDTALQNSESDVLYKVKFRGKYEWAYLYVLAEHQSSIDDWMPFRLWQYIVAIWNELKKKNKKAKLPLVIPLVFYNGRTRYNGPRDIRELIDAPAELIEEFLLKPFHLIDTQDIVDKDLKSQHVSSLMEFVMKHAYEKEALKNIQYLIQLLLFNFGRNMLDKEYYATVLKYYIGNAKTADPSKLQETLAKGLSSSEEGEVMATIESYLTEIGKQKGGSTMLQRQLERKFGWVSEPLLLRIQNADSNSLLRWAEKVLDAESIDGVFS